MQTAILAVADLFVAAGALTYFAPQAALLLEGASLIVLLAFALAAIAAGPMLVVLGVSIWSPLLGGAYLLSVYVLWHYQGRAGWQPVDVPESAEREEDAPQGEQDRYADRSTARLGLLFALGGLVLLAAGWAVASAAEAIAQQTGLGTSFVGATLVAASTSLPEVSTTIAAVRLGSYAMAISNIFGSNAIDTALLFFADVLYREGSIFTALDQSSSFAAAAAIVVTAVYLIGLIERRNLVVLRMGVDSAAVLALYAGAVFMLYQLR
jgi:cation:H+ antiporter